MSPDVSQHKDISHKLVSIQRKIALMPSDMNYACINLLCHSHCNLSVSFPYPQMIIDPPHPNPDGLGMGVGVGMCVLKLIQFDIGNQAFALLHEFF